MPKPRHANTRQGMPRPRHAKAKARHANARQSKAKPMQGKASQSHGKARQGKPKPWKGNARQGKARHAEAKARHTNARKGKARQGFTKATARQRKHVKKTKCRMGSLAKFWGKVEWKRRGRDESKRRRAESQWIVAARPLCHLQYPVAYLSRLQRILPAAR